LEDEDLHNIKASCVLNSRVSLSTYSNPMDTWLRFLRVLIFDYDSRSEEWMAGFVSKWWIQR
jgi:hypothetical protein